MNLSSGIFSIEALLLSLIITIPKKKRININDHSLQLCTLIWDGYSFLNVLQQISFNFTSIQSNVYSKCDHSYITVEENWSHKVLNDLLININLENGRASI